MEQKVVDQRSKCRWQRLTPDWHGLFFINRCIQRGDVLLDHRVKSAIVALECFGHGCHDTRVQLLLLLDLW